jgi:hypothetical protein
LGIKHKDGTEVEIGPGEAYVMEPGHARGWSATSGSSDSSSSRGRPRNTRNARATVPPALRCLVLATDERISEYLDPGLPAQP